MEISIDNATEADMKDPKSLFEGVKKVVGEVDVKSRYWFVLGVLLYTVISATPQYALGGVTAEDKQVARRYQMAYIIMTGILPLASFINRWYTNIFGGKMVKYFIQNAYAKYERLSYRSKHDEPSDTFRRKMDRARWSIHAVIDWGLPTIINLGSSILGAIYIFYKNDMQMELMMIFGWNGLIYLFVTRRIQYRYTTMQTERRDNRDRIIDNINNLLQRFEEGDVSVEELVVLEITLINEQTKLHNWWQLITLITQFVNNASTGLLLFQDEMDSGYFLLMSGAILSVTGSIQQFMSFMNQYSQYQMDYGTYVNIWKGKEFKKPAAKLLTPKTIKIVKIDIRQDYATVQGDGFTIQQGDRFLITGPSGSGKTTLINGILGKIPGIELERDTTENYEHEWIEYFQHIKEKMRTSKITIRQLFNGELHDATIEHHLKMAHVDKWANKLTEKHDKRAKQHPIKSELTLLYELIIWVKDVLETVFDWWDGIEKNNDDESEHILIKPLIADDKPKKNPYDVMIKSRHSGGEKSRLALAVKMYWAAKKKAKLFFLDEGEQGSDPEIAYKIIRNLLNEFPNTTIFVISHLELITTRFKWNHYLTVMNGVVTKKLLE